MGEGPFCPGLASQHLLTNWTKRLNRFLLSDTLHVINGSGYGVVECGVVGGGGRGSEEGGVGVWDEGDG